MVGAYHTDGSGDVMMAEEVIVVGSHESKVIGWNGRRD